MNLSSAFSRFEEGLLYEDFLQIWQQRLHSPPVDMDRVARKYFFYAKYNWDRSERLHASYAPSQDLITALDAIRAPQRWLVLTEDWCVDSAYCLPILAEAARRFPLVSLRVFLRDQNPDIMDLYLTNGGRSIPKLVGFSPEGNELFQWGPRTQEAVRFRETLLAQGLDKATVSARLSEWYEAGGWRELDAELAALVTQSVGIGKVPFE